MRCRAVVRPPRWPPKLIIAHRGASAYCAENTLAALQAAARMGAPAAELDVKRSADGRVVVIHDATVDRTAHNGHGAVRHLPYAQLRALNVGDRAAPQPIPTLEQVLTTVGDRLLLNIELTNYDAPWDDLPYRVAALLQAWGRPERVWVSSFNPLALARCRRACPGIALGYLVSPRPASVLVYRLVGRHLTHAALHPHRSLVDTAWVRAAHIAGRRVFPYTVNAYGELRRLLQRAWVDGLFTDRPDVALKVRAALLEHHAPAGG